MHFEPTCARWTLFWHILGEWSLWLRSRYALGALCQKKTKGKIKMETDPKTGMGNHFMLEGHSM